MNARRRAWVLWACGWMAVSASQAQLKEVQPLKPLVGGDWRDWWLDLSLPPASAVPADARDAQVQQVRQQQNEVARRVYAMGGQVIGRATLVRNALAVRMREDKLTELGQLPGVTGVRPVSHIDTPQTLR